MNIVRLIMCGLCAFIFLSISHPSAISCEPEKYPPDPEILWPPDNANSVPLDTAIIVKDFKSLSKQAPKLQMDLRDSYEKSVEFEIKKYQSRRSVYNYEAGFIVFKPTQKLRPLEEYTLTIKAKEGFASPIEGSIKFSTGDENTLATSPGEIDFSYYFSEPGYYLSNCQTSTWDKATSLFFINSKVEGYPLLLVLDSNLLKDVSFFHSSMKKRELALLFLPNEKGINQCFDLSVYAVNGDKVLTEKYCKPSKCTKGKYLTKEQKQEQYNKHGAFGFSMIEFPSSERELPNYCTLYPPLCREYWSSVADNSCSASN